MPEKPGGWRSGLELVEAALSEIREGVVEAESLRARADEGIAAACGLRRTLESKEGVDLGRLEVLGLLGAGVAHELNNLLFVIRGTAEISKMGLSDEDPMRAKFGRIEEAVDRAEGLTRMVLHTARPTGGGPVPIQLHPLVKECLKMTASGLPDNVKIHQQIATDAAAVAVDPVQYFKVVMTSLSAAANAFEEEGGRLWVTLGPIEVEDRPGRPNGLTIGGPFLMLTVAYAVGEDVNEDCRSQPSHGDRRPFRLSEIEGIPRAIDTIVDDIGGFVTCRPIADGGRCLEISLPITQPPAVR